MHTSYKLNLKHPPDFKVKYCFLSKENGGRTTPPSQGYRSDFWYEHPDHLKKQLFMIWPEFENENGEIIFQSDILVPNEGIARMWIVNSQWRAYHKEKIKIGLKGFFMEGQRKVAECEVIEIIGLLTNPIVD
jgi:hypothetical protein